MTRQALLSASEETKPLEEALSQVWRDIQIAKEEINRIISPVRYDADLALKALTPASHRIVEGYGTWGARLPKETREAWHSAKNSVVSIVASLEIWTKNVTIGAKMRPTLLRQLKESRRSLTDMQAILQDSRQNLRSSYIKRILEGK